MSRSEFDDPKLPRKMLFSRVIFCTFLIATFAIATTHTVKLHGLESLKRSISKLQLNSTYYDDVTDYDKKLRNKNAHLKTTKTKINTSSHQKISSRRNKRSVDVFNPNRRGGLVCSLCMVLDQQFATSHELPDRSAVISVLYKMIDRISWIFRNIDWNDDGTPDNFGFEITDLILDWKPYPDEAEESYDAPKPSMQLLAKFAELDFRSCCLGVGITNRPFEENHVGVSFIADQKLFGGICDYRTPPFQQKVSPNSALISGRGVGGSVLSLQDVETVLIHELGHAFGVLKHDRDIVQLGSPECSGFLQNEDVIPPDYLADTSEPPKGRYIMWGQELQGSMALKVNHLKFSPCSKRAVMGIFQNQEGRTSCLKVDRTPFCGNGLLEHPEECDCGNEISCSENKCCGPRGSTAPCKLFKGIDSNECIYTKVANSFSNQSRTGRAGRSQSKAKSIHSQVCIHYTVLLLVFTAHVFILFVFYYYLM